MKLDQKNLLKIGLNVIKNLDSQIALNELYLACRGRFIQLQNQIKPPIKEDK